jgi:hypothetical protein
VSAIAHKRKHAQQSRDDRRSHGLHYTVEFALALKMFYDSAGG